MTNRREFLQGGLAASALPFAAPALAAADRFGAVPRPDSIALYKILYDTRFPASVEFARRAAANGHAVHASNGDMTRFWYDDLYHRWREGPAAVAGLTARGALFCLEQLAWEQRMRVVFRAEHSLTATGCVAHTFEGPAGLPAAAATAVAGADWAAAMADVVAQCPRQRLERRSARAETLAPTVLAATTEPLFTWVIAPVARA